MVPIFVPVPAEMQERDVTSAVSSSFLPIPPKGTEPKGREESRVECSAGSDISLSLPFACLDETTGTGNQSASSSTGNVEEQQSSTDTSESSPIFASKRKTSSAGSATEDEKEGLAMAKEGDEGALQSSPGGISDSLATEQPEQQQDHVPNSRPLTARRSFWNLLRSSTASLPAPPVPALPNDPPAVAPTTEASEEEAPKAGVEESNRPLRKRSSFSPFPNLAVSWTKASRRHTVTADGPTSFVASALNERSLDGNVYLPQRDVDEVKMAEDAVRFADARHVIKTEQRIEVIRELAQRLEQGWREKQIELAEKRAKLEEAQMHLHDIRDENKHVRSQLGGLSEQVVARDHDFEELQKLTVEQSKKEREIWEEEKRQAIEKVRVQLREMQAKVLRLQHTQQSYSTDEEDQLSERDLVLFSATTSMDSEMHFQHYNRAASPSALLTTPTTPTLLLSRSHWPNRTVGSEADPLKERLEALQAEHGMATGMSRRLD